MLHLHQQETPSRILRRIREAENDMDLPSLPSMASGDVTSDDEASKSKMNTMNMSSSVDGSLSMPAGRAGQSNNNTNSRHQNNKTSTTNNNGRNILSPLKLNGRIGNTTNSPPSNNKGKGKATAQEDSPKSVGPLSAVSSNRTVRPAGTSPNAFRGTSVTPSAHVTSRSSKHNKRNHFSSYQDTSSSSTSLPGSDHPQEDQHRQSSSVANIVEEQSHGLPNTLNLDLSDDSGFPERPQLETSIWSKKSDGRIHSANSALPIRPTPLKKVSFPEDYSISSAGEASRDKSHPLTTQDDLSLPPALSPERQEHTYDYTTGSPIANGHANAQYDDASQRRGSTSSSASGTTSEMPQIQVTPAPASMVRARRVIIRSSSASFEKGNMNDSIGTTPGMGRRVPSAERRGNRSTSYDLDSRFIEGQTDTQEDDETTPSKRTPSSSSNAITAPSTAYTSSRAYSYAQTPEIMATPRASDTTDADLERRKMHLLSTLRMTALKSNKKLSRFTARGTPHPRDRRRARSVTPGLETINSRDEDSTAEYDAARSTSRRRNEDLTAMSSSSALSDGSSNDLTTNPRGHGNTSLPIGGAGITADGGTRFNNTKLNNYLHTLNTHLTTENQNLIKTLEETAREVTRLMRKNENLSSRVNGSEEELSTDNRGHSISKRADGDEGEDGDLTREMLHSHRKTSRDISQIRQHLTGDDADESSHSAELLEQLRERDAKLEKMQADLQQRDAEIVAMRADVLKQSQGVTGEKSDVQSSEVALQEQVFELRDEVSRFRSENTLQSKDLQKLRAEQLEQSSRHNKVIAELTNRTDDLLAELDEKDAIIEEIENELVKQEDDFKSKMTNLEEELCKVMEEQEVQLREARKEVQVLKQARSGSDNDAASSDLLEKIASLEKERETLKSDKEKAQAMLKEATATIANSAATGNQDREANTGVQSEGLAFLQKRIAELEASSLSKDEQIAELQQQLADEIHDHQAKIQELEQELDEADNLKVQLERKIASQGVLLQGTEKAFMDSEDNVRQSAEELDEARNQLHDLQNHMADLQAQQAELFDDDLQKKYDAAMREIGNLKHQLAHPMSTAQDAPAGKYAKHDSRDLEIKTLRSSNHELETRVHQLRKQAIVANQSLGNRSSSMTGTPARSEKSVRFNSIRSLKTPRTASQMLGGMSFLDKTGNTSAANATASPLYAEIDTLNREIRQYKGLLNSANEEVDDKLRKLDSAGMNVVSMSKELDNARRRIRDLEAGAPAGRTVGEGVIIKELRAVRDELTNERSSLLRRLKEIQDQCRQMSQQLDGTRSAHAETQKKLEMQAAELRRIQGKAGSATNAGGSKTCSDPAHRELEAERDAIFAGVAALKRDLTKVQHDATELGQDLRTVKSASGVGSYAPGAVSSVCTKTDCINAQARTKQEAKGLLLMITHLKAKFTRESYFRADLGHQKMYLLLRLDQKQRMLNATNASLERFGLPAAELPTRPRMSLKIAAQAVIATIRMQKMSEEWKKQCAVKTALREAYKQTRGKPFVPAA